MMMMMIIIMIIIVMMAMMTMVITVVTCDEDGRGCSPAGTSLCGRGGDGRGISPDGTSPQCNRQLELQANPAAKCRSRTLQSNPLRPPGRRIR